MRAAHATHAASAYSAFVDEAKLVDERHYAGRPIGAEALLRLPLWRDGVPEHFAGFWAELKNLLSSLNQGWDVWIELYEAELNGAVFNKPLDMAIALKPDEFWEQDIPTINAEIRRLVDEFSPPVPKRPASGRHMGIDPKSGKIRFATTEELDAEGNNIARLTAQHPNLLRHAGDLAALVNPNEHPDLATAATNYYKAINLPLETINFELVYSEGLFFETALEISERHLKHDEDLPQLGRDAATKLAMVTKFHATFISATVAGQQNLADAREYHETLVQGLARKADEVAFLKKLAKSDLVEADTAAGLNHLANLQESAAHGERGGAFLSSTVVDAVGNLSTGAMIYTSGFETLGHVSGGFLGSLPFVYLFTKSFEKSDVGDRTLRAGGKLIDLGYGQIRSMGRASFKGFADFILSHEILLRRIGEKPSTEINKFIDWLKRQRGEE